MNELLQECYQRELDGKEPCNPSTHGLAIELIINELVILRSYTYSTGSRKAAYFITDKGKEFIKKSNWEILKADFASL